MAFSLINKLNNTVAKAESSVEKVKMKMSNLVDTFLTRLHVMPHSLLRHSIFVF